MNAYRFTISTVPAVVALALAMTLNPARAEAAKSTTERPPSKTDLRKYDANRDGRLDEAEAARRDADSEARRAKARAQREADLEKYDANHDGKLGKDERARMKEDDAKERETRSADRSGSSRRRGG